MRAARPISGTPAIYQLGEEHEALREAVRSVAAKEIEPHAAEVDELERYPAEAREALTRSGFHAVHIPGQYGGEGADGVATCILNGSHWILNGTKSWITNAGEATWYTVSGNQPGCQPEG